MEFYKTPIIFDIDKLLSSSVPPVYNLLRDNDVRVIDVEESTLIIPP